VIQAPDLGVRITADEYGDDEYIRIDMEKGSIWQSYDGETASLLEEGSIRQEHGSNALVVVDGREMETDGLDLNLVTANLSGQIRFSAGDLGEAGLAQVGYSTGSLYSGVGAMASTDVSRAGLTHGSAEAGEKLVDFSGGVQLQLAEVGSQQGNLALGLRSMMADSLGRTAFRDDFNGDGLKEQKYLTLGDMLGGGLGSLATDPVKTLDIIDAAIEEVATQRARIGAMQKNLLETNANSLHVAVENITHTESAIRDADMAKEMAAYTRGSILQQASMGMLAQANALQQNVLTLLA
jgi:flagellin-like hook-associated protein FlgL